MKFLKSDSIPFWAHIAFLLALMTAAIPIVAETILYILKGSFNVEFLPMVIYCAFGLIVIVLVWPRYWFLLGDFKKIILSKGGSFRKVSRNYIVDDKLKEKIDKFPAKTKKIPPEDYKKIALQRYRRSKYNTLTFIGAKIGKLLLFGDFLHPIFPTMDWDWEEDNYRDIIRVKNKFYGEMMKGTTINIFSLGNFGKLASIKLEIYPVRDNKTGHSIFDRALEEALKTLKGENVVMTLQIRDEWLRIKIRGGPWLGGKFGRRISEALEFTERLVELLSPHVKLYDPDKWTIDFVGYDYRVRQVD